MLTDCNQTLIRATVEKDLLDNVCRIVVNEGGYRLAWVGLAEDLSEKVRLASSAGFTRIQADTFKIYCGQTEAERGPAAQAVHSGQPSIIQDILRVSDGPIERSRRDRSVFGSAHDGRKGIGRIDGLLDRAAGVRLGGTGVTAGAGR